MTTLKSLLLIGVLSLAASHRSEADVLIGNYGFVGDPKPALAFATGASGNVAPAQILGGGVAQIVSATNFTYEPVEDVVYVADFYGQAVRVFGVGARGDVAARRTLTAPNIGQPRGVVIDRVHDEMLVLGGGCCVFTYARTADGPSAQFSRYLQWGGLTGSVTQLNNPISITFIEPRDEIALTDYANGSFTPRVLVFARGAGGNTAPLRVIEGAATKLGTSARSVVFEPSSQLLFVLASDALVGGVAHARIAVFNTVADGNVAPLRVIEGPLTGLDMQGENLGGLGLDPLNQRLLVAISGGANSRLLAFGYGDSGNAAPALRLAGAQTGVTDPGTPIGIPDRILRVGFER